MEILLLITIGLFLDQCKLYYELYNLIAHSGIAELQIMCYNEIAGENYQVCDIQLGFQTCFTKFDESEFIIGCNNKNEDAAFYCYTFF